MPPTPHMAEKRKGRLMPGALTGFEERVVLRLSKGARLRFLESGHARLGPLNVPASLVERLMAADLLDVSAQEAQLSQVGASFAARLRSQQGYARKPSAGAPEGSEQEDQFAAQHRDMETQEREIGDAAQKVRVNRNESPLWWLMARRDKAGKPLITELQFAAGERLRQDWEMAQLGPRVCMSWSDTPPDRTRRGAPASPDLPPGALRAKERVNAAIAHCGEGLGDILVRVCCNHEGLNDAERALNWPRRSGKLILGFGLDRLAEFYGLSAGKVPRR